MFRALQILSFGIIAALAVFPLRSAEAPDRKSEIPSRPLSPEEAATLAKFSKALEAPDVKLWGDIWNRGYQFGKKCEPQFLNVIMQDLIRENSFGDPNRFAGPVHALIYGPAENQAVEILKWWQENGNEFQKDAARDWLETHEKMRLVEHEDGYELKYRVWPNLLIQAKEKKISVPELLKILKTRVPVRSDFQHRACKAYRIGPHTDEPDGPSIGPWHIIAGPVAVTKETSDLIARHICDSVNVNGGSQCALQPGLAFRFERKGEAPIDVFVCFICGDMETVQNGKPGFVLGFSPTLRRDFLKVGRQVAPDDEVWKQIETDLNE